jgi:uncharacterized coiled-coil protein SlyX
MLPSMADQPDTAVNSGEQSTSTSSNLPISQEAQFRVINQRLDTLTTQLGQVAKPPHFRLAEVIELSVIVIGLVVAGFTALGLNERITDVSNNLAAAEQRLTASMNAMELRLQNKLDKLSEQFTTMDERISRIEGQNSVKPTAIPPH